MKNLRVIIDGPKSIEENMAIDEAIFLAKIGTDNTTSTLRFYEWTAPGFSIGYSQSYAAFYKNGAKVIRRLTGGLAVPHDKDLAYSFVTDDKDWPEIYDQDETYRKIHGAIKLALNDLGVNAVFSIQRPETKQSLCRETFLSHDVEINGKKILGSCQRRRGKVILQQGSIKCDAIDKLQLSKLIVRNVAGIIEAEPVELSITKAEIYTKAKLIPEKYLNPEWNRKFP